MDKGHWSALRLGPAQYAAPPPFVPFAVRLLRSRCGSHPVQGRAEPTHDLEDPCLADGSTTGAPRGATTRPVASGIAARSTTGSFEPTAARLSSGSVAWEKGSRLPSSSNT